MPKLVHNARPYTDRRATHWHVSMWADGKPLMDGWMDGWMDGCINGWMDGCINGWIDRYCKYL